PSQNGTDDIALSMAVVWLIDLFGDYQSTNSKPPPPLSAQIVNPIFPQQPRRTFLFPGKQGQAGRCQATKRTDKQWAPPVELVGVAEKARDKQSAQCRSKTKTDKVFHNTSFSAIDPAAVRFWPNPAAPQA
ncbi:hypothetical protein, partial [Massilia phosphatilytica]